MKIPLKDVLLREKCTKALKEMLPYNELYVEPKIRNNKVLSIELQMRNQSMIIKPDGSLWSDLNYRFNPNNEVKICMLDIFLEFREEIMELFNLKA